MTSVAHHRRLSAPDCHSDRLALLPSALDSTSKGDYLWYLLVKTLHALDFIIWNMAQSTQSKTKVQNHNSLGRLLNMLCRHAQTHPTHTYTHTQKMQAALQRRSIAGHLKRTTKRTQLNIQCLCHSLIFTMIIIFLCCASLQLYNCMMGNMNIRHEKFVANNLIKKNPLQGLGWEHC